MWKGEEIGGKTKMTAEILILTKPGLHTSCTDAQICAGRLGSSHRKVRSKTTRHKKLNQNGMHATQPTMSQIKLKT